MSAQLVTRPRLVERLRRGLTVPLTLVCASAGYGKTTLVSAWIEEIAAPRDATTPPLPAAWLSLDEDDSDLTIFVRYLCAAIETLFPAACTQTLALLHAPRQAPLDVLIATLSNELNRLPTDCIVVLDDFHLVSGVAVPDLLAGLLRHWPWSVHLVVITRRDPALPLSGLRAKGYLSEIRTRELRFTAAEVAQYLTRVTGQPPSEEAVAQLERQTEGWITGLYLATLALGRESAAAWSGKVESDTGIADYLVGDLLASQPPDVLRFLLQTALVNQFCVLLCEQLVEASPTDRDARACLEWLEGTNFLITALGGRPEWYRYHHLMQDVLRRQAAAVLGADQVRDVHRRAAGWFAQQGMIEEALRHALEAGELGWAARLMEEALCAVLNREDRPTLERWARLLPEDFRHSRPGLLMMDVWLRHFGWQLGDLAQPLQQVETLIGEDAGTLSADDLRILQGQILALRAQEAHLNNQPGRSIAYAQEALALLPQSWTFVRGLCMLYLGGSMQTSGQGDAADRRLWAAYKAAPEKSDSYALRILFALCLTKIQAGEMEQARQTGVLMLEQARRGKSFLVEGWAHCLLGLVYYQWNELETAAQHFHAITEQLYSLHSSTVWLGLLGLILVQFARRELAGAEQTVVLLSQLDVDTLSYETEDTLAARAWLQFLRGDVVSAWRWADAYTAPAPDQPLYGPEDPRIVRARLLLARGADADVQTAQQIVDALYDVAERTHNTRFRIVLLAMRALALEAQGRSDAAHASLQHAVELARPGGIIRAFADLGSPMQALLSRLAGQGVAGEAVRHILTAFPVPEPEKKLHPPAQSPPPLVEPLTARELDILPLLRERLSNKEIAEKLGISIVTVKRHIANLSSKLGVHKRLDVVATAEALGILPPR